MNLTVLTPDKEVFLGTIKSVKVPGSDGQFQILNNHAPLVASLDAGDVFIVTGEGEFQLYNAESKGLAPQTAAGKNISFQVASGFIEVLNNEVSLLVSGVKDIK